MDILDECDALLDLHSYNSPEGEAFAITKSNGYDFVSRMNVPLVASGLATWDMVVITTCLGAERLVYVSSVGRVITMRFLHRLLNV